MNAEEQWLKWEPIKRASGEYTIDEIIDSLEGLTITISEYDHPNNKLKFFFKDSASAYRCTEESYRIKISESMVQPDGVDLYRSWSFFKVKNSTYLLWLEEESCGFFPSKFFTHFAIVGENQIVDIATIGNPIIERL